MKFVKFLFVLFLTLNRCRTQAPPDSNRTQANTHDFLTIFRNWNVEKGKIPEDVVSPFLGHGGTYESVHPFTWRHKTVEPSHIPHHSILEYVDPNKLDLLPENIRSAVKTRKELETQLAATNYPLNESRMETLKVKIDELMKTLKKLIPVNKWANSTLGVHFYDNIRKMTSTQSKIIQLEATFKSDPFGDSQLEIEIANHKKILNDLQQQNKYLRMEAEKKIKTVEKKAQLDTLKGEYKALEDENKELSKTLEVHNENIKKAMGVLSLPYDKHRIFPSIAFGGFNEVIRALQDANSSEAKAVMEEYDTYWKQDIDNGIQKGFINPGNDFQLVEDKKVYDYDAMWKHNFDKVIKAVETERMEMDSITVRTGSRKKRSHTPASVEQDYLTRVHLSYAKKFMVTTIYFVKTPEVGYSRLVNLYIDEFKLYMKNDFDSYKLGISQLLEANKQFGWITDSDVWEISDLHKLHDIETVVDASAIAKVNAENDWKALGELIKLKSETSYNPIIPDANHGSTSASTGAGLVCTAFDMQNRSDSETPNCIIFSKKKDISYVDFTSDRYFKEIGLPKLKIGLPSDADTDFIDSKRLKNYFINIKDNDIHSIRIKEAVAEFTGRNLDKLIGTHDEIAGVKASLRQEDLDSHAEQISLGAQLLSQNENNFISTKAVVKYKQVKVSTSKLTTKLGKITNDIIKISKPNKKIMLAKGVVSALRHGDYESLAMMGGSIGLEAALSGVTKLGNHIAQNVTTKFMTRFGSEFLGKVASPTGVISDIGINIYSLEKSVKILNDPNATKFDRNEAISHVLADSIDLVLIASSPDLFPVSLPRTPDFVEVLFVRNLSNVSFFKSANHVDKVNEQIPTLDFDQPRKYRRYISNGDKRDYTQELIDFKKANNIKVDMNFQFLKDSPDYIGKVSPSRTLYQPEKECVLEKKVCQRLLHFITGNCEDWRRVSSCAGHGGYCSGDYSNRKCQSHSGTGLVMPLQGHEDVEYRCTCGSEPPPLWGYEIQDSEVNFRYKQNVYLQRTAPDHSMPYGFSYLCKPSSLSNEGERVSLPWTETGYYCKGAIGIKRSNNRGTFMLYDLGNGNDFVLDESETVDNMFVVKDGHKKYEGNAGDDTFLLDGPCNYLRGWLDGKGFKSLGNSIVLGSNCNSNGRLEVNLQSGNMYFGGYSLDLRSIQRVIGRKEKSDIVRASCSTKLIVGSGGRSSTDPDEIHLPTSCGTSTEITVGLEGSAAVHATSFSGGKCFVLLQNRGLSFKAHVPPVLRSGTLLFKFQESVGKLTSATITNGATIQLEFEGGGTATIELSQISRQESGTCGKRSGGNPIQILITENSQISRQLSFNLGTPGQLQAIHVLEGWGDLRIQGYDFIDNVFYLRSGQWNVVGGRGKVNQFVLESFRFSGSIDGTSNGQNTLQISSNLNIGPIRVDLNAEEISSSQGRITVKNIQTLVGRPESIENVVTSCGVKYLELGGNVRDVVNIPRSDCSPEIIISARGKLTVEDRKSSGATTIEAGYFDKCSGRSEESLDLHIKTFGGGDTSLLFNTSISTITAASSTFLRLNGREAGKVAVTGKFPYIYFEEDYNIQSALFYNSGKLHAFHVLKIQDTFQHIPKLRKGSKVIPNVFKLVNGKNWRLEGGNEGDVFSFTDKSFSGSVNGLQGRNKLFIGDSIQGIVQVKKSDLFVVGQRALTLNNIQEIHGRARQSEDVEVGCDTLHLALNGGNRDTGYT